jgi:hypothetical protein
VDVYVIPCSAGKLEKPARAVDLYTGSMFRHTLAAAQSAAGRADGQVLILSAEYGLIPLDRVIAPYDRKMGEPGSVTAGRLLRQAVELNLLEPDRAVYALLPQAYYATLARALRGAGALQGRGVPLVDLYARTRGIGEQRAVNARLLRKQPVPDNT